MGRRTALVAALAAYTAAFHAVSVALRDTTFAGVIWSDANWTAVALAATLKSHHTAVRASSPGAAAAWRRIGFGCGLWFTGMLIWDFKELVLQVVTPFPSVAEVFFVGAVVPIVAGIFAYRPRSTSQNLTLKQLGDLGVVVSTMVMVCSIVLYRPAMQTSASGAYISAVLAYPIVHMSGLAFGALCFWQGAVGNERRVVGLLLVALAILTGVTAVYAGTLLDGVYVSGQFDLDVFWIATFVFVIWAAFEEDWRPAAPRPATGPVPIRALDPLVSVVSVSAVGVAMLRGNWTQELVPVMSACFFLMAISLGIRHRGTMLVERDLAARLRALNVALEDRVRARTAELVDARDAAELANRSKSRFLANMSHELRTPLTAIIGYSEMLIDDASARPEGEVSVRDLRQIEAAGKQLLQLINEILDLSKVEAGRLELSNETVDVDALLAEVRSTMIPMTQRNGNTLVVLRAAEFRRMTTDANRLRQVLFNLLSNAAKFTRDGTIRLEAQAADGWASFVVTDTGVGMSEADLQRVFEPFERASHGVARAEGTGLGLAISRRFCEVLGGELGASSSPGVGSAFTVRLPVEPPLPASVAVDLGSAAGRGRA